MCIERPEREPRRRRDWRQACSRARILALRPLRLGSLKLTPSTHSVVVAFSAAILCPFPLHVSLLHDPFMIPPFSFCPAATSDNICLLALEFSKCLFFFPRRASNSKFFFLREGVEIESNEHACARTRNRFLPRRTDHKTLRRAFVR